MCSWLFFHSHIQRANVHTLETFYDVGEVSTKDSGVNLTDLFVLPIPSSIPYILSKSSWSVVHAIAIKKHQAGCILEYPSPRGGRPQSKSINLLQIFLIMVSNGVRLNL